MLLEVLHTNDGSTTLLNKELNATYHSKYGAIQESKHIFINNGLNKSIADFGKNITILEIGFGTGLNAFLTLREATLKQLNIRYITIEKYPVPENLFEKLNYPELINDVEKEEFNKILNCKWEYETEINPHFKITKCKADIREIEFREKANIIYYDAFAPSVAPEMWQQPIFEKLNTTLLQKGSIITFCAKGEVKRHLKQCGFNVETLPGPVGKREITRALKT